MADTVSLERRSQIMARVKSHGNKSTEIAMIGAFRNLAIKGWRRGRLAKKLPGRPDFVFPRQKIAIFGDGCFWHGHPKLCRVPESNRAYWIAKIKRNKLRDRIVRCDLRSRGWMIVRIWEHEIYSIKTAKKLLSLFT